MLSKLKETLSPDDRLKMKHVRHLKKLEEKCRLHWLTCDNKLVYGYLRGGNECFNECGDPNVFISLIKRYCTIKTCNTLGALESLFDADNVKKSVFLRRFFADYDDEWISVDDILQMPQFCELFGRYGWNQQQYEMNKAVFVKMVQSGSRMLELSKDKGSIRKILRDAVHEPNVEIAEQMKRSGNKLFKQQNYRKAIEKYLEALRYNEYDYKITMNLSCAYMQIEEYENALKYANISISLQPIYGKPYAKAALAYFALDKKQIAIAAIDHAIRHQPKNERYLALRNDWMGSGV